MPSACMDHDKHLKHQLDMHMKCDDRRTKTKPNHLNGTFIALISNAIPPQADGDAIDVPFISMRL